jgi:hypothetical protein
MSCGRCCNRAWGGFVKEGVLHLSPFIDGPLTGACLHTSYSKLHKLDTKIEALPAIRV